MAAVTSQKPLHPEVLWAQRANEVYVTINLSDVENPKINLTNTTLTFAGDSKGSPYEVSLEFNKEVDPEASRQNVTARNITFVIAKKEQDQPWWPRLLKGTGKSPHWLKTDFAKWKDEDDDDADEMAPGMDYSQFAQMGGMGGMG
ncbi:hypothetical protein HK102_011777, partial [Quaeritorhiza haematococci]